MAGSLIILAVGLDAVAFVLFGIVHIILWRVRVGRAGYGLMLLVFAAAYPLVVLVTYPVHGGDSGVVCLTLSVYLLLMLLYLHLYSGMLKSLSVRILGELTRAPGYRLTLSELDERYGKRAMLEGRVQAMMRAGLVAPDREGFKCSSSGQRMAQFLEFMAAVFARRVTG